MVTNVNAVVDAVSQLETFPMTMGQLQETRIGQLLQTIRHKVDAPLQKRIRSVIRAWQKLLSPEFASLSVIPIKCSTMVTSAAPAVSSSTASEHRKSNGASLTFIARDNVARTSQSPLTSVPSTAFPVRQTDGAAAIPPNSASRPLKRTHSSITLGTSGPVTSAQMPNTPPCATTPNKRFKAHDNSYPYSLSPVTTISTAKPPTTVHPESLVNGTQRPTPSTRTSQLSKQNTLFPTKSTTSIIPARHIGEKPSTPSESAKVDANRNAVRLAKVKSTAELVQAAGDCIDSATADRILTNRISKEADPPRPSVIPLLMKSKQSRPTSSSAGVHRVGPSPRTRGPTQAPSPAPSKPATTAQPMARSESPLTSHHHHQTSELATCTKNRTTFGEPSAPVSVESKGELNLVQKAEAERTTVAVDSDNQQVKEGHRKKEKHRHRHKHRHRTESDEKTHHHSPVVHIPPITNHLDDWPRLPPLPSHIDWSSLDYTPLGTRSSGGATFSESDITRLLVDNWPGVNCTVDEDGNSYPLTELYSLTLGDQYLHILPWIDVFGARRHFFPVSDLDTLTELPEPW
ncbi:unnamed protein product [Dicrocoelium dendriticum]|nr:unnamed protein product [Dicrocoelium dendriticum]